MCNALGKMKHSGGFCHNGAMTTSAYLIVLCTMCLSAKTLEHVKRSGFVKKTTCSMK